MKTIIFRTITVIFCITISSVNVFAQKTLTYTGAFEDKRIDVLTGDYDHAYGGASGTATYEYYENNNQDRIFEGKFTLKNGQLQINGNFKNNLKDGHWKYIISKSPDNTNFEPCLATAEGNYSNGKLNGTWVFSLVDKKTSKKYSYSKATFINNLVVGTFEFSENSKNKFEFKINYDSISNYNGSYYVKYWVESIPFEDQKEYKHGEIIKSLHRNIATGEKIDSKSYRYLNGDFWNLYTALNFWGCNSSGYNGCIRGDNPIFLLAKGTDLKVDNSAKEEKIKNNIALKNNITINNLISSADSCQSHNNLECAHDFYLRAKNFCQNQSMQLPNELSSKLADCENAIKNKEKAENGKRAQELILYADKFETTKDYEKAIAKLEDANKILPNKNVENRIASLKQKKYDAEIAKEKAEQELKQKKYELALFAADSIAKTGDYDGAMTALGKGSAISTAYNKHLDKNIIDRTDLYEKFTSNVNELQKKHNDLINSDLSTEKPTIIATYNLLYKEFLQAKSDIFEYSKELNRFRGLQENIIKNIIPEKNKKVKPLIKALSETESLSTKKDLLNRYPWDLYGKPY
jgi:hypothetical protein